MTALAILAFFAVLFYGAATTRVAYIAKKAKDGDTVRAFHRGRWVDVRIRYGDAPEIDQPGGKASKAELERLVGGQWVVLDRPGVEPWGRVLAGLRVGGRCVSEVMIKSGHMVAYYANAACKRAEAAAKKARRGFWSRPGRVLPKDWRKGRR